MKPDYILQIFLVSIYLLISVNEITADRPCAARQIANRSVVCVCNATYCDEITRTVPCRGQYVAYTSSNAGSRFKKSIGYFGCQNRGKYTVELDLSQKYQTIKGFGGAVTDSASIKWKSLPKAAQQHLINSYFSKTGLEYNIVRVPIGCSDFSVRYYTLDDTAGDCSLKSFALQDEDLNYKIPMLKEIFKVATSEVYVLGGYWTPPLWMKYKTRTNTHCGFLKEEYYQTFANYLIKFMEFYKKEGINIWAITTGNEPSIAGSASLLISCLGWDNYNQANWIVNNLGPTLRNSAFRHVKLLALDDQLYTVRLVFDDMVRNNSKVLDYLDGVALHYYTDSFVSPKIIKDVTKKYPKLFVISTEACEGFKGQNKGVVLGSWKRASKYIKDIIRDLNHDESGWIDWNLCLDTNGGPNVDKNFVDSPIIVDCKKQEFVKQPMFYALGHFSKFICRGSVVVASSYPSCDSPVTHVAVVTPKNTIVVVLHNTGDATSVTLKQGNKVATIDMEADSIMTVEYLNEC